MLLLVLLVQLLLSALCSQQHLVEKNSLHVSQDLQPTLLLQLLCQELGRMGSLQAALGLELMHEQALPALTEWLCHALCCAYKQGLHKVVLASPLAVEGCHLDEVLYILQESQCKLCAAEYAVTFHTPAAAAAAAAMVPFGNAETEAHGETNHVVHVKGPEALQSAAWGTLPAVMLRLQMVKAGCEVSNVCSGTDDPGLVDSRDCALAGS